MSSAATMHMPDLGFQPNRFTLHNATPERIDMRWGGLAFTLPAVDEVGPKSAQYEDGTPIPGTLVLQDAITTDRDGIVPPLGSPPNWLAFEAIRNVLGVDTITKKAEGALAKAGVSFLPNSPTREVVAFVRADGEKRYQEHLLDWAEHTVSAYQAIVQKSREVGVVPAPPGRDYMKATVILSERRKTLEKTMQAAPSTVEEDAEMEALTFAKAKAMELAEKAAAGKGIDRKALAEEIMQDPEMRAYLMQKGYRIRKKGHLDVPAPEEPQEE